VSKKRSNRGGYRQPANPAPVAMLVGDWASSVTGYPPTSLSCLSNLSTC